MTYELPYSGEKYDVGSYDQDCCIYSKAEDSIASFSDGADDYPMKSVVAQIVPKQEGTGDPSPDNVRPISGYDSVVIEQRGKNLFNKNATNTANGYVQGKWLRGSNGVMSNDSTSSVSEYIEMKPNTQYTVSGTYGTNPGVCFYDEDKTFISGQGYNSTVSNPVCTFITPSGTAYARFSIVNEMVDRMQLELGSTATAYEPYQGSPYSIPFKDSEDNPITVYGGEIDVVSGEGTETMAMVDLGTLTWRPYGNTQNYDRYVSASIDAIAKQGGHGICSQYKADNQYYANHLILGTGGSMLSVCTEVGAFADATAFKTAMSGVQLVYELKTPTPIYCEPTEIKTLKGNNNIWCDTGDISVEYLAQLERDTLPYSGQKYNVGNFEPIEGEESPHDIPYHVGIYEPIKEKSREGIEYIIL